MSRDATAAQESRTERVAMALTPSEKRAVVGLASFRRTDQSNLLREMLVEDIVAEYGRVEEKVRKLMESDPEPAEEVA